MELVDKGLPSAIETMARSKLNWDLMYFHLPFPLDHLVDKHCKAVCQGAKVEATPAS